VRQGNIRHTEDISQVQAIRRHETYAVVEGVAVPIPSFQQLDLVTFVLSPGVTVRERSVEGKDDNAQRQEDNSTCLSDYRLVANTE